METPTINQEVKRIDRIIDYIVHHAWLKTGIFFVALLETTISPIVPEVFVAAALTYRKDISWKILSLISALGSATGAAILYILGKFLYKTHEAFFDHILNTSAIASYTQGVLSGNTFVTIFLASFTPLPDRVFAFFSGVFSLSFIIVVCAFFVGRLLRVSIVAYFSYHFGDEARGYILKHTKLAFGVVAGLVVAYILYKTLR